jgi:hypothetical protein
MGHVNILADAGRHGAGAGRRRAGVLLKYEHICGAVWFLPLNRNEAVEAIKKAYHTAQEHARKIGGRLEPIQPRHIYGDAADKFGYTLQLGRITVNLPPASVVVLWGFYNADEYLDFVRFIQDSRVYEWFVEPIAYYPERVGVWLEEPLVFRNVVYIDVHTTSTEEVDRAYGWPLGYFISPLQPPQEVKPPRRPRGGGGPRREGGRRS